jgi:hypothetical protein
MNGSTTGSTRSRTWLRAGLLVLTAITAVTGAWQLFLPESFYGLRWVSLLPPFNEHLMRDVGAGTLATAVVLAAATVYLERRLVVTALAASLTFSVPHTIFHATHLAGFTAADAVGQMASLALTVALPAALLALSGYWNAAKTPSAGRALPE